jgi:uncharacterized protein involved in response to NO
MNPVRSILYLSGRGEPYRILFPLGAALGVLGALLWPAFVYGGLSMYPGIPHARIMVQGFVFSFVAGFLSSALPHMLEVKGLSPGQTCILAMLIILVAGLQVAGFTRLGDALFAVAVAVLLMLIAAAGLHPCGAWTDSGIDWFLLLVVIRACRIYAANISTGETSPQSCVYSFSCARGGGVFAAENGRASQSSLNCPQVA